MLEPGRCPHTVTPTFPGAVKELGLTLEEVEAAEGGVVRESAVGMAQTKRAVKRKGSRAGKAGRSGAPAV